MAHWQYSIVEVNVPSILHIIGKLGAILWVRRPN